MATSGTGRWRHALLLSGALLALPAAAQETDTLAVCYRDGITVWAPRCEAVLVGAWREKSAVAQVLERHGFAVVRRGAFLAQDVYVDGLRRGDIALVIDGERCQCACPNRMDAPVSRLAPLDLARIELDKSASPLQAGLGGLVSVHRTEPGEQPRLRATVAQTLGRAVATDLAAALEQHRQRLTVRYARGRPDVDGSGRSYSEQYDYRWQRAYHLGEAAWLGRRAAWEYAASVMVSDDVSFPYLKMDERRSAVYNASLGRGGRKLYVTCTDHTMDNGRRATATTMPMRTEATNLTIGARGHASEAYFRYWDADNRFRGIRNPMIPSVGVWGAAVQQQRAWRGTALRLRAGGTAYRVGDASGLARLQAVHGAAEGHAIYPTLAASLSRRQSLGPRLALDASLDLVTEPPEVEACYLTVQKAPAPAPSNPAWTCGNPRLSQPSRLAVRGSVSTSAARLEAFCSYVVDYVTLQSTVAQTQKYLTYGNANVLLAGASLDVDWRFLGCHAAWTYGQNRRDDRPLSEILPLRVTTQVTSPSLAGVTFHLRHRHEERQSRIDRALMETPTPAWDALDAGCTSQWHRCTLALEVENLTDATYSRHLSYLRDPFASGARVYEPGATVHMQVRWALE